MRFFIALEIPEDSRRQIESVQASLKRLFPEIRLTDSDKFHLTIAFIGEQPEQMKTTLVNIMLNAVDKIPPFAVTPALIDGFPSLHNSKVLWIGVKGDTDKLMIIRERIKDGLKDLNLVVDERRYEPHIAIAKSHNFYLSEEKEASLQAIILSRYFEPIKITSLKLFESIPSGGLHKHNTLAEVVLNSYLNTY